MAERNYWWNKLNIELSDQYSDGEITEEEMEAKLDRAAQLDARQLKSFCLKLGIGKKLKFKPDWYLPPGSIVNECLVEKNISKEEFANKMSESPDWVDRLITGSVELNRDIAERLNRTVGVPAEFWLQCEQTYRRDKERLASEHNV